MKKFNKFVKKLFKQLKVKHFIIKTVYGKLKVLKYNKKSNWSILPVKYNI